MHWEIRVFLIIVSIVCYKQVRYFYDSQPELTKLIKTLKTSYHGMDYELGLKNFEFMQQINLKIFERNDLFKLLHPSRINEFIGIYIEENNKSDNANLIKNQIKFTYFQYDKNDPIKPSLINIFFQKKNVKQSKTDNCLFSTNNNVPGFDQINKFYYSIQEFQNYLQNKDLNESYLLPAYNLNNATQCQDFFEIIKQMKDNGWDYTLEQFSLVNKNYDNPIQLDVSKKLILQQQYKSGNNCGKLKQAVFIIQNFLQNPFLINNQLVIFETFVLITSFQPFQVFYYQNLLLAHICKHNFDDKNAFRNCFSSQNNLEEKSLSFMELKEYLFEQHNKQQEFDRLANNIQNLIYHYLNSLQQDIYKEDPRNFQLIKIKFFIDSQLNTYFQGSNTIENLIPEIEEEQYQEQFIKDYISFLKELNQIRYHQFKDQIMQMIKQDYDAIDFITLDHWYDYKEWSMKGQILNSSYGFKKIDIQDE